jgi:hypothetical protein
MSQGRSGNWRKSRVSLPAGHLLLSSPLHQEKVRCSIFSRQRAAYTSLKKRKVRSSGKEDKQEGKRQDKRLWNSNRLGSLAITSLPIPLHAYNRRMVY